MSVEFSKFPEAASNITKVNGETNHYTFSQFHSAK